MSESSPWILKVGGKKYNFANNLKKCKVLMDK